MKKYYYNKSADERMKLVAEIVRKIANNNENVYTLDIGYADNPNPYFTTKICGLDLKKREVPENYLYVWEGDLNNLDKKKIQDLWKFEIITACELIEHVENPSLFIRNCKKLLKPKGFLILTTPTPYYYKTILGNLLKPKGRSSIVLHLHDFIPRILNNVAITEGFEVIQVRNVNSKIPFINWQLLYIYRSKD